MRNWLLSLSLLASGCSLAPGMPLTDVTATNTEDTGHYDVVERQVQGGRHVLTVRADQPEQAERIAEKLVYQLLPYSPDEVVIEIRGAGEGGDATPRRIIWQRPPAPTSSEWRSGSGDTAAGDRIGQPGQH
jgi:hypothetical protein